MTSMILLGIILLIALFALDGYFNPRIEFVNATNKRVNVYLMYNKWDGNKVTRMCKYLFHI